MIFAERIKELREIRKLTQKNVAEALGIDIPMYSRIERGHRNAKKEHLHILSSIYGIKEDELYQLWLADRVYGMIAEEQSASEILNIVAEKLSTYGK